jgi:hypothetical protein
MSVCGTWRTHQPMPAGTRYIIPKTSRCRGVENLTSASVPEKSLVRHFKLQATLPLNFPAFFSLLVFLSASATFVQRGAVP